MREQWRIAAAAVCAAALAAGGCGKGPAEAALREADEALAAARPELETYVPDEWRSLGRSLSAARARLEQGEYGEALRSARDLLPRIESAVGAARRRKDDMVAAFHELRSSLPPLVRSLLTRVAALAGARRLPRGVNRAMVGSAQRELAAIASDWNEAASGFEAGDVPAALERARSVGARAEELAAALGVAVEGEPVVTNTAAE